MSTQPENRNTARKPTPADASTAPSKSTENPQHREPRHAQPTTAQPPTKRMSARFATRPASSRLIRVRALLGRQTVGGLLVLIGAIVGLALANTGASSAFRTLAATRVGPTSLGFGLTIQEWAQEGLLAVFFFTVGTELITEIRIGSLQQLSKAAVPVLAACGGVAVPALIYTLLIFATANSHLASGWAVPTATDIAFALSVLAIAGKSMPERRLAGLRVFLLTLATVDDLIGILVIAVFYSQGLNFIFLAAALAAVAVFAWLARWRHPQWWLLVPVALLAWGCTYHSGVDATISGVALGLVVPVHWMHDEEFSRSVRFSDIVMPISNVIALPLFAMFAAGVPVNLSGGHGQPALLGQPLVWAVAAALVLGKPIGVMLTTATVTRWTSLALPEHVTMRSLLPVAMLCGIGFTVSMLIAGLAFPDPTLVDEARAAILLGSATSAILGGLLLWHDSTRSADTRH